MKQKLRKITQLKSKKKKPVIIGSSINTPIICFASFPIGSPSPAPNSSPKDSSTMNSGTLQRKISSVSAQLSRQESGSGSDSPRKMSTDSNFELMKTPSFGFSRGPSPLTLGNNVYLKNQKSKCSKI